MSSLLFGGKKKSKVKRSKSKRGGTLQNLATPAVLLAVNQFMKSRKLRKLSKKSKRSKTQKVKKTRGKK
tara:strand:+ start:335 stop:541 length:207 start_codon:yes stop_codon:yes gene_type:complete